MQASHGFDFGTHSIDAGLRSTAAEYAAPASFLRCHDPARLERPPFVAEDLGAGERVEKVVSERLTKR